MGQCCSPQGSEQVKESPSNENAITVGTASRGEAQPSKKQEGKGERMSLEESTAETGTFNPPSLAVDPACTQHSSDTLLDVSRSVVQAVHG